MRTLIIIVLALFLLGTIAIVAWPMKTTGISFWPSLQSCAAEEDIYSLPGDFNPSGVEQDGIIARSGWERLNETANSSYWEYNLLFKEYVQEDLTHTIQTIEGVVSVNVSLNLRTAPEYQTNESQSWTGTVFVRFQLDRDVYDDSQPQDPITEWGKAIDLNLTALLETKWYVTPGSVLLHYEIPHEEDSADAGFTLGVTIAVLTLLPLFIRKRGPRDLKGTPQG